MQAMNDLNLLITCDEPAAPEWTPPQRISAGSIWVNTALPLRASKEALRREAIMRWFNEFHGSGVNPGSCLFLQNLKNSLNPVTRLPDLHTGYRCNQEDDHRLVYQVNKE
jgi:hypothetical protein